MNGDARPRLRIALVAGEESGDQLGAEIMDALHIRLGAQFDLIFAGLGGDRMIQRGLSSSFEQSEVAVMGISAVLKRLPRIIRLAYRLIDDIVAFEPDFMMIIDSPDLTHPVARKVRKRRPNLPVVNYVSPSVWAWRSGRARKMVRYIDHVLAILPFEPAAYKRLKGPACTYVGHPLVSKLESIKAKLPAQSKTPSPTLLLMPGSRMSEVSRLLPPFADVVKRLSQELPDLRVEIPVVGHLEHFVREKTADWPLMPNLVLGEQEKFAAFERANAALVASGTATLELALWGVPMVVGYRLDPIARRLKWLGEVDSIVLPNLILGQNTIPEFVDDDCEPDALYSALEPLLRDPNCRNSQLGAFEKLADLCSVPGETPALYAIDTLLNAKLIKPAD